MEKKVIKNTKTPSGQRKQFGSTLNKAAIIIPLVKICPYNPNWKVDEKLRPINYRGTSIFFLKDSIFWYAIQINGMLFAFDLRPIYSSLKFGDATEQTWDILNNQEEWLSDTIGRINESPFYLDFEQSLAKYNDNKFDNRK